jgi:hypothetical protein
MDDAHFAVIKIAVAALVAPFLLALMARSLKLEYRTSFGIAGLLSLVAIVCGGVHYRQFVGLLVSGADPLNTWLLRLCVAVTLGVSVGLIIFGRRELRKIGAAVIARARLELDELRDPQLRLRNRAARKYEFALTLLITPSVGRPEYVRRNKLLAITTIRDLTDEEITIIAEHMNMMFFAGEADARQLVIFLEEERQLAATEPLLVNMHLVRLNQLANRLKLTIVAELPT